ncbi:MAG: hypothetical protein J6K75_00170 [Erysipelotrichaceae bacterium]|nr:hypothetical protein [Erysipelotrichaceae bacterium]
MENFVVRQMAKDIVKYLNSRSNSDFEINDTQFKKFKEVLNFFTTLAQENKNTKVDVFLEPKQTVGGLTCTTYLLDFYGKQMEEFNKLLSYCCAVTIDTMIDGKVCISVNVPDVFVEKKTRMMN